MKAIKTKFQADLNKLLKKLTTKEMCEVIAKADILKKEDGTAPTPREIYEHSPAGELHMIFEWFVVAKMVLANDNYNWRNTMKDKDKYRDGEIDRLIKKWSGRLSTLTAIKHTNGMAWRIMREMLKDLDQLRNKPNKLSNSPSKTL